MNTLVQNGRPCAPHKEGTLGQIDGYPGSNRAPLWVGHTERASWVRLMSTLVQLVHERDGEEHDLPLLERNGASCGCISVFRLSFCVRCPLITQS
jgi:hypothetical protein